METKTIKVEGMSCMHCVKTIETNVASIKGVNSVKVSLKEESVLVDYDPAITGEKEVKEMIESVGYEIRS